MKKDPIKKARDILKNIEDRNNKPIDDQYSKECSLEAWEHVKPITKDNHRIIINAMKLIGVKCTSVDISKASCLDRIEVSRRMSELRNMYWVKEIGKTNVDGFKTPFTQYELI